MRSTNYLTAILGSLILTPIFGAFAFAFTAEKIHWSLALLLNVVVWWLFLEMLWDTMITITVVERTITVSKPFRKNSLLSRKKHHQIVIREDEWDQLFYMNNKDGTVCYFRQGRSVAYYFTADGFWRWTKHLQEIFPEKRVKVMEDGSPREVIKALRKEFPERVL